MMATQQRVLRVFGVSAPFVAATLRQAQSEGCPGLRLLEKDGEFAICVKASAPSQAVADSYCDKWIRELAVRFDAAVCGVGSVSLAHATLNALLQERKLVVAADEQTGRLLGGVLRPLEHSEAVFDFGNQSYANSLRAKKIATPAAIAKKFPGDVLQAAAGRAQSALQVSGADYAALYMPATVGQAPFVVVTDKREAAACALAPNLTETAIANNLLDLLRRRVLGMKLSESSMVFRPGHEAPLLLFSQNSLMDTREISLDLVPNSGKRAFAGSGVQEPVAEHTGVELDRAAVEADGEEDEDTTEYAMPHLRSAMTPTAVPPAQQNPAVDPTGWEGRSIQREDPKEAVPELPALGQETLYEDMMEAQSEQEPAPQSEEERAAEQETLSAAASAARRFAQLRGKAAKAERIQAEQEAFAAMEEPPPRASIRFETEEDEEPVPQQEVFEEPAEELPAEPSVPDAQNALSGLGDLNVGALPLLPEEEEEAEPQDPAVEADIDALLEGLMGDAPQAYRSGKKPEPSVLDKEIPDFSIEPMESGETAQTEPEAVEPVEPSEETPSPEDSEEAQRYTRRRAPHRGQAKPQKSGMGKAAQSLYGEGEAEPETPRSKSLAAIERREHRQEVTMRMVLVLLVLVLLACVGGLWYFLAGNLGSKPDAKGYGTAAFDKKAVAYLNKAFGKMDDVVGYLAFPQAEGELVYSDAALTKTTAFGGALSGGTVADEVTLPRLNGDFWLGGQTPSNTVLDCGGVSLAGMTDSSIAAKNNGFTLYTVDATYRFKVVAVCSDGFAADPAELSSYYDYLQFVCDLRGKSLFDMGVAVPEDSQFLTLVSSGAESGQQVTVVGRLIRSGENAQLSASAVKPTDPEGKNTSAALEWYAVQSMVDLSAPPPAEQAGDNGVGVDLEALSQTIGTLQGQTEALLNNADKLLAGLTDVAGSGSSTIETGIQQGASGSLPEQTITVEQLTAATPTPAPTATPEPTPTQAPAEGEQTQQEPTATPAPTQAPTPTPQQSTAAGETINVTMNGTAQTMDLVTCLAMVAQNELGSNAPMEAYKAQCVATHCWILSQGGYPSVLGATPGANARAAAEAVAHVLITYNGAVCFTPYFASASTGTASSADVWGGSRAYLQAVDSPYDRQVASNWNTNGSSTGCARFAADTLCQAVKDRTGIDLSGVDKNQWFKILSANPYGWVTKVQIGPDGGQNTTCSGVWFRETLTARKSVDGRSLRSQCFTVTYDASLDCFIFDVYGYGHGCGMSQWGAIGYARNGWSYDAILKHYFTGVTLTTY